MLQRCWSIQYLTAGKHAPTATRSYSRQNNNALIIITLTRMITLFNGNVTGGSAPKIELKPTCHLIKSVFPHLLGVSLILMHEIWLQQDRKGHYVSSSFIKVSVNMYASRQKDILTGYCHHVPVIKITDKKLMLRRQPTFSQSITHLNFPLPHSYVIFSFLPFMQ